MTGAWWMRLGKRLWRGVRAAGTRRLLLAMGLLALALGVARYSWSLPATGDAERTLYDLRAAHYAPRVEPDPRVLLVVYDDQTLIAARKRSPLDRGILARALQNLDAMGARAIGIDILFDQPQDEDDALVATLRSMRTPVSVAYADLATNPDDLQWDQQQFLAAFLGRLKGSRAHPASIRLDNTFGVTRVWPRPMPGSPPELSRAMLTAAGDGHLARPEYTGAIRYRLPARDTGQDVRPVYTQLKVDLFADLDPALAPVFAEQVRGRFVLIGASLVDQDRVETSLTYLTGETVPGITVHADMLAQLLDRATYRPPAAWFPWAQAVLLVVLAVLSGLLEARSWKFAPLVAVQLALIAALPFWLHSQGVDTFGLPAVGPLLGWVIAYVAAVTIARASGAVQRRFAQDALGKYLPREMAREIIERPELLALHGEKKPIFVLFSDLEGFTKMSHALEPETVARLLNRYLDQLSQVVLDHGGVLDKFVGDAVVAFWGAPIAHADDGARAARAGYALWQAGEKFRAEVDPSLPPIGRTRVGMHWGEAVVGNFGGENRIQYTALGDSMNTAARLEGANKTLGSNVLASRELVERSGLDWWRPMGTVKVRGRAQPVEVFDIAPEWTAEDRAALGEAIALARRDPDGATAKINDLAARYPTDSAIKSLLQRVRLTDEDGAYALS
jgi:adenylate cyclase